MTHDPHTIAHALTRTIRRLRCPQCGDRAIIEDEMPMRPRTRLVRVQCLYHDHYEQLFEIPERGEPRTIERPAIDVSVASRAQPLDIGDTKRERRPVCLVPGCKRRADEGGLCHPHHIKWRLDGRPDDKRAWIERMKSAESAKPKRNGHRNGGRKPSTPSQCGVRGCYSEARARGLCKLCHSRWSYRGKPDLSAFKDEGLPQRMKMSEPCEVDGCDRPSCANGLCNTCGVRWRAYGKPDLEAFKRAGLSDRMKRMRAQRAKARV